MAVNVNTVYLRVLAIANKEQRGYITPQEFNTMANQAQLDTFEQYFYDLNQFARIPGNSTEYSDMLDILEEKISVFEVRDGTVDSGVELPDDLYRLGNIYYNNILAEKISLKEWSYIKKSPLSHPTADFPIYVRYKDGNINVAVYADATGSNKITFVSCDYVRKPISVSWAYDSTTGLYDANNSVHFELHPSEETELVIKILALSGVVLK